MIDRESTAAALYGSSTPSPATQTSPVGARGAQTTADALYVGNASKDQEAGKVLAKVTEPTPPSEPSDTASVLFDGGPGLTASEADTVLSSGFDSLQTQLRSDGDVESAESVRQGRVDAAGFIEEAGIGRSDTQQVTVALSRYATAEDMSDEQVSQGNERCEQVLRQRWGSSYDAKLADAQAAFRSAATRLPWLWQLNDSGAGVDPDVVAHFSKIGARMRAKGRR